MNRKEKIQLEQLNQVINVYKPAGITSYDVVRQVRRLLGRQNRVGHAGTLDPFGEGVLLIMLGKATKQMTEILQLPKIYEAHLRLGAGTASGDHTLPVIRTAPVPIITDAMLEEVRQRFTGTIEQIPPAFSAKKINGRPAYHFARKGKSVTLKPVSVQIYDLKIQPIRNDLLRLEIRCSSGTYIRKLGEDIARAIGTEGHLTYLKRISIGQYRWEQALPFDQLAQELINIIKQGMN